jgi:hypothetical protein
VPQMPQGAPQQRRAMPMGLNRACSMPSAGSGPPMSPLMHARNRQQASQLQAVQFQAAQLQMRRQMPDAGASFSGFELPPKPPGQRLQPGGGASSPFAGVVHRGGAGMERIEEPADGDTLLRCAQVQLTAGQTSCCGAVVGCLLLTGWQLGANGGVSRAPWVCCLLAPVFSF